MADSKLKVAMVAFVPNYHTSRWARSLVKAGVDITVVHIDEGVPPRLATIDRVPVSMQGNWLPGVSTAHRWRKALMQVQPDVIYMQWLFASPSMVAALPRDIPLAITVMGSDVRQERSMHETLRERTWRSALLRRAHLITVAARPLAEVVASYGESLRHRIELVPFGVDTQEFQPGPPRAPDGGLTIGHFKGDHPLYGRIDLLHVCEDLLRHGMDLRLLLAGRTDNDGGEVARFLAAHPHLAARTRNLGMLAIEQMPALYREVDIYVLNSVHESFGVAAAEALACGVPVIGAQVGGVPELVRPGHTGILVPPRDHGALRAALCELYDHPLLRASMAIRGRQLVQSQFEWDACVARMVDVLHRTAGQRRTVEGPVTSLTAAAGRVALRYLGSPLPRDEPYR